MSQYGVSFVATVYAWDTSAGSYKTGDSANITLYWLKDGTASTTTNACAEVSSANTPGQYKVTLTATEAQCTAGTLGGKSSTANIIIIPAQFTFESADFTATQKTSIGTAVAASAVASVTGNVGGNVTGSVGSVTGNVGGNVVGSVASVTAGVTLANGAITTAKFAAAAIDSTVLATSAEDAISANVLAAAAAAPIAANLKKINGTTVNGDGSGTPWGP